MFKISNEQYTEWKMIKANIPYIDIETDKVSMADEYIRYDKITYESETKLVINEPKLRWYEDEPVSNGQKFIGRIVYYLKTLWAIAIIINAIIVIIIMANRILGLNEKHKN